MIVKIWCLSQVAGVMMLITVYCLASTPICQTAKEWKQLLSDCDLRLVGATNEAGPVFVAGEPYSACWITSKRDSGWVTHTLRQTVCHVATAECTVPHCDLCQAGSADKCLQCEFGYTVTSDDACDVGRDYLTSGNGATDHCLQATAKVPGCLFSPNQHYKPNQRYKLCVDPSE